MEKNSLIKKGITILMPKFFIGHIYKVKTMKFVNLNKLCINFVDKISPLVRKSLNILS